VLPKIETSKIMKIEQSVENLTPESLEKQEHLTKELLARFIPKYGAPANRPPANFIDLMNWAMEKFSVALIDQHYLNKLVHNRIVIDGQFLHYCELNNITVECLNQDSTISWQTEHNYEKFFMQGVFLIRSKEVEFLLGSLWHKGNANEDEISFFTIVSDSNYESYIKLRNDFDEWVLNRDRNNLHIRVIDGEDIPYTREHTWEDLFLPKLMKEDIKKSVEDFLNGQDFYLENKIPWKKGILLYGIQGCGKTSIIRTIISMYNFKPITIVPGANDEAMREAFAYAEEQSPSLLYFEDLDSILDKSIDISSFLNLMDGISSKNGLLVIATANDITKLKANITDRPSRFDRKFRIPLPDNQMAYAYLKKWFGTMLSVKKCRELAKYAEKYEFSYAYLKELYISSMFEALSNNRKTPTEKDIDKALERLMKDKNILSNKINIDRYTKNRG
jgi:ATPase family associated with various cellular activities (AAA)